MSSRRFTLLICFALCTALAFAVPAAAQVNFETLLFGQNEVPPVATEAYGSCVGVLDESEDTFVLSCEHNLDDADLVGAHIHIGFSDENGPIVFDLGDPTSPIQGIWDLDDDQVVRLLAGGFYVNVHTLQNPAGEIRGQLQPTAPFVERRLVFPLRSDLVVPPSGTDAEGVCFAQVMIESVPFVPVQRVTVDLRCTHEVDEADAVVIRNAPAGEEGDVVLDLPVTTSPFETTFELNTGDLVAAFLAGDLYLSIESPTFPDGELRGQMEGCLEGPEHLCLNDNRFEVTVNWTTRNDSGDGMAVQETDDSGLFWFFRPSNIELLVKVLDGCSVNDRYWVFLAGTTDVGFNLQVTDTETGESRVYSNTRGTIADTILDANAFDTCP